MSIYRFIHNWYNLIRSHWTSWPAVLLAARGRCWFSFQRLPWPAFTIPTMNCEYRWKETTMKMFDSKMWQNMFMDKRATCLQWKDMIKFTKKHKNTFAAILCLWLLFNDISNEVALEYINPKKGVISGLDILLSGRKAYLRSDSCKYISSSSWNNRKGIKRPWLFLL